jgi:putative GTP pyrophosphokinase
VGARRGVREILAVVTATADGSKIEEEYARQRSAYEAFTENAYEILGKLLESRGIEFSSAEKRTKSMESLRGKVERGGKAGKYNSLQEITDLSGIRIIAFLKEDCKKISALLSEAFVVDEANSLDKEDDIDPDRWYQSIHLILEYSADRLKLPEFKRFAGLKFEVQVKTLLQHTWSAIDWKLRYKRSSAAPKRLRRRLFRISALLDAADDELSYVYHQVSDIKSYYANAISSGDLSLEIDLDSVNALLTSRAGPDGPIAKLIAKLNPAPSMNQTEQQESISSGLFLPSLKAAGLTELHQLDQRIKSIDDVQFAKLQAAVKDWLDEIKSTTWSTNRFDIGLLVLLMTAPVEVAKEILKVWSFNPTLTAKIKHQLGIEELAPEPKVPA